MKQTIIGYRRVSTQKQGESGLGLEAQDHALRGYAQHSGASILRVYTEVESGRRNDRPELAKALAHARRSKAQLVVAKLDRLSRNVAFLSALMESKVEFVCCDFPTANKLTIHILAAVAEDESRRISQRTKEAMAAYRARGGKLGANDPRCKCLNDEARKRGAIAAGRLQTEHARQAYADLLPQMMEWRHSGQTYREIASQLNAQGHTTRRGSCWRETQVMRVLERA